METASKTGLGHQLKKHQKALLFAKSHLEEAYKALYEIIPANYDLNLLSQDIAELIQSADRLASSAEEAYNQND